MSNEDEENELQQFEKKDAVLLIWESIPEYITLYMFPEDHEDIEFILACQGVFINLNDTQENSKGVFFVNEKMETEREENGETIRENTYAPFLIGSTEHDVPKDPFLSGDYNITKVVLSGFHL